MDEITIYENSLIYKIMFNGIVIYVGSTINLYRRTKEHMNNPFNPNANQYNTKIYKYMRDNGFDGIFGNNGFEMVVVEYFPCRTRKQKTARERHHYFLLGSPPYQNIVGRTNQERNTINNPRHNLINNARMVICPVCNREMRNTQFYVHKKTCIPRCHIQLIQPDVDTPTAL